MKISEPENRYKKIFWLSIFSALTISPIWFFGLKYVPNVTMNNPVQMFLVVWSMSLLFSIIFFLVYYSGEVMVKPHKKGIYYKCVLGLMVFMVFGAFAIPALDF